MFKSGKKMTYQLRLHKIKKAYLSRIRIRLFKTGSADPDPGKMEPDPQYWTENISVDVVDAQDSVYIFRKMIFFVSLLKLPLRRVEMDRAGLTILGIPTESTKNLNLH